MKFKDSKTGEVFEDIMYARYIYCKRGVDCELCAIGKRSPHECIDFCSCSPAEAARLMGYEVVEEAPTTDEEKQVVLRDVSRKEANMDKQKPLKDWTLGEIQEHCKSENCFECPFNKPGDKLCGASATTPANWDLTEKPRFTEEEVELARSIVKVFGLDKFDRLHRTLDGILRVEGNSGFIATRDGLFPSIKPAQFVQLIDIVGGDA